MVISGTVNIELTNTELYNCAYEVATGRRYLKIRDLTITIDEVQAEKILLESNRITKQFIELIRQAKTGKE